METSTTPPSLTELPPLLTVPEAAAICRISRSAAYEQANEYLRSDGAVGLPAVRLGRRLRVPSALLIARILGGHLND